MRCGLIPPSARLAVSHRTLRRGAVSPPERCLASLGGTGRLPVARPADPDLGLQRRGLGVPPRAAMCTAGLERRLPGTTSPKACNSAPAWSREAARRSWVASSSPACAGPRTEPRGSSSCEPALWSDAAMISGPGERCHVSRRPREAKPPACQHRAVPPSRSNQLLLIETGTRSPMPAPSTPATPPQIAARKTDPLQTSETREKSE